MVPETESATVIVATLPWPPYAYVIVRSGSVSVETRLAPSSVRLQETPVVDDSAVVAPAALRVSVCTSPAASATVVPPGAYA